MYPHGAPVRCQLTQDERDGPLAHDAMAIRAQQVVPVPFFRGTERHLLLAAGAESRVLIQGGFHNDAGAQGQGAAWVSQKTGTETSLNVTSTLSQM